MKAALGIVPGLVLYPGYLDRAAQRALVEELRAVLAIAPLFQPRMPGSGKPFSVSMSNCGPLGWVSDEGGYRYQPTHPTTGAPPPEACLINYYGAGARLGCIRIATKRSFPRRSFRCP
jgi:alkylated DNA repair protein (DNA oxidative demethylase)